MTDDDDTIDKRPYDPELAAMLHGALKAKARFVAFGMALAVGTFVWMAKDAGQPMWLVVTIGVLGAVLIVFFIALVWFWLRFLRHFAGSAPSPLRGGEGVGVAGPSAVSSKPTEPGSSTPIPDPSRKGEGSAREIIDNA